MKNNKIKRKDHELPKCIIQWGWEFHHVGIPTEIIKKDESHIKHLKFHVSGFSSSPFGIEWMRFEEDCRIDKLIQQIPHVAFRVKDLDYELENRDFNIISKPNSPSGGVRVAMIEHNGAPVELIEFNSIKEPAN